jgi:hypothetical protein
MAQLLTGQEADATMAYGRLARAVKEASDQLTLEDAKQILLGNFEKVEKITVLCTLCTAMKQIPALLLERALEIGRERFPNCPETESLGELTLLITTGCTVRSPGLTAPVAEACALTIFSLAEDKVKELSADSLEFIFSGATGMPRGVVGQQR